MSNSRMIAEAVHNVFAQLGKWTFLVQYSRFRTLCDRRDQLCNPREERGADISAGRLNNVCSGGQWPSLTTTAANYTTHAVRLC